MVQNFTARYERCLTIGNENNTNTSKNDDFLHNLRQKMLYRKLEEIIRRHPQGCFMYGIHQSMDAISFFAKEWVSFDYPASYRGWQKHSFRHVGLKTVHRTVFLTPSQFSRDNYSLTAIISIYKKLCYGRAFCICTYCIIS